MGAYSFATSQTAGGGSMSIGGAVGSGTAKSVLFVDGSGNLGQDNPAFTYDSTAHALNFGSTSTGGYWYNTVDQVTNPEFLRIYWTGNIATILTGKAGSGAARAIQITTPAGATFAIPAATAQPMTINNGGPYTNAYTTGHLSISPTMGNTTGNTVGSNVNITYNQASGSGTNTDSLINRVMTASSTGTQKFIDAQVNGTSWYSFFAGNTATTSAFNASATAEVGVLLAPVVAQTSTAGFTALKMATTESTTGSGQNNFITCLGGVSAATQRFRVDNLGSTYISTGATSGLTLYNQADEVTNYELGRIYWSTNQFQILTTKGGTGTARSIVLSVAGVNVITINNTAVPLMTFTTGTTATAGNIVSYVGNALTGTSGTQTHFYINPTWNQASGSAFSNDLVINRVITSLASSNPSKFLDMQVNATSWYSFYSGQTATTGAFNSSTITENAVVLAPVINQSSTAGFTILKINPTQTATGSGTKLLLDLQAGSTSYFNVSNLGVQTWGVETVVTPVNSAVGVTGQSVTIATSGTSRLAIGRLSTTFTAMWVHGNNSATNYFFATNGTDLVFNTPSASTNYVYQNQAVQIAVMNQNGIFSTYNKIGTAGLGLPAIYASGRSVAQTAAVPSVSTYTLPATDGTFEVSANVLVTTAGSASFTVTCAYTDEGNTARTVTLTFGLVAGLVATTTVLAANGAVPYMGVPIHIRCKASTAITIATTGTFTGCTYNVEGVIRQLA